MPSAGRNSGDVTFRIMHIPKVHVPFDKFSEFLPISTEYLGLRSGSYDENLAWRIGVELDMVNWMCFCVRRGLGSGGIE